MSAYETLTPGDILARMPAGEHELWEYAASNRARIDSAEDEIVRLRERYHELSSELAAIKLLGQAVQQLARQVGVLTDEVGGISRNAVRRLTLRDWQSLASIVAALVAVVALALALRR